MMGDFFLLNTGTTSVLRGYKGNLNWFFLQVYKNLFYPKCQNMLKQSGLNLNTGCFWKSGSRSSGLDTILTLLNFILIFINYHTDTGSGKNVGSFSS
jgi:hypothetical protein